MPLYLDNYRVFFGGIGIYLPFYLAFVIVVRDLSYLEPSRGALCVTAVIDTGRRISVV